MERPFPTLCQVRALLPADYPAVLQINQDSVHFLSPLSEAALHAICIESNCALVVEDGGEVVAFLLTLPPGAMYRSVNYRWFAEHYAQFLYVDRVVVSLRHLRRGYGERLYAAVMAFANAHGIARIACEFDLHPPNHASLAFHEGYGFGEVGTQLLPGGEKSVSLRILELAGGS